METPKVKLTKEQIKEIRKLRSKWLYWLVFKVSIPLTFAFFSFLMTYSGGVPFAFYKVFSSGDLLLFSGMLCMSMYVDLLFEKTELPESLDWYSPAGLFVSIVFLVMYGWFKSQAVAYIYPADPTKLAEINNKIPYFAFCSILAAIFSVLLASSASNRITKAAVEQIGQT